jgi:hypothetical protein
MQFIINNDPKYHRFKEVVDKYINMYTDGKITQMELVHRLSEICVLKEDIQASVVAGSEDAGPKTQIPQNEGLVE